jgi:MFS family permease
MSSGSAPAEAATTASVTLWHHGDFLRLWVGETVSVFGSQISQLAIPLVAALVLGADPAAMGVLGALEMLPFLVLSLPAGVWADRLRRRPILISADLLRAVTLLAIPVTAATGHLSMPVLYVVALVTGIGTVFFDVSYQSYLPSLVDRGQLIDGNSKLELTRSASQLAGPGLGGALVTAIGAPYAIVFDSLSFLFSAGMLGSIRRAEPTPKPHLEGRPAGMIAEIREGGAVVFRNPILRAIAATTATSNFFSSMGGAVLILFATRELGMDGLGVGLAFAVANVGALLGAVLAARLAGRLGVGRTLMAAVTLGSLTALLVPLASREVGFLLLTLGFFGEAAGGTIYNINQVSLRQAITPDRRQGRMNASMRFVVWGVMPIASIVGGVLGTVIGIRATLVIAALGGLLQVAWLAVSPVRTLRTPPPPWDPAGESTAGK